MRVYGAGGGAVAMFGAEMMRRQAEQAAALCASMPGDPACQPHPHAVGVWWIVLIVAGFVAVAGVLLWWAEAQEEGR